MIAQSEQLINAYIEEQNKIFTAKKNEEAWVLATLRSVTQTGIRVWLGAFAQELEPDPHKNEEYSFRPGNRPGKGGYAKLETFWLWNGISVTIAVGATGADERSYPSAELTFVWPRYESVSGHEYFVKLPCETDTVENWGFVVAKGPISALDFGKVLYYVLEMEKSYRAEVEEQDRRNTEYLRRKYTREIQGAESSVELQTAYTLALSACPDSSAYFQPIFTQRETELEQQRAAAQQRERGMHAIRTWLEQWRAVVLANRQVLAQIQARYEYSFRVGKLTYAAVAWSNGDDDDDVEQRITTREMFCHPGSLPTLICSPRGVDVLTAEEPAYKRHVFSPVMLDYPEYTIKTAPSELVRMLYVPLCITDIRFPSLESYDTVQKQLDQAGFADLPMQPADLPADGWSQVVNEMFADDLQARCLLHAANPGTSSADPF